MDAIQEQGAMEMYCIYTKSEKVYFSAENMHVFYLYCTFLPSSAAMHLLYLINPPPHTHTYPHM